MRTADMSEKQRRAYGLVDEIQVAASRLRDYLERDLSNERIDTILAWKLADLADDLRDAMSLLQEED